MSEVESTRALPLAERANRVSLTIRRLGSSSCLALVRMLEAGEMPAQAIAAALGITQPACGQHLSHLRHARLVERSRRGRDVFYEPTDRGRVLA